MRNIRSFIATGAVALAASAGIAVSAAGASPVSTGQPARHGELLKSGLIGRPGDPSLTVAIRGVTPGAVPWALDRGTARLDADGRLQVDVDGLVITGTNSALDGTTGPVKTVAATLACAGAVPAMATTETVPLSPDGDARINEHLALPVVCPAPVVLIRANAATGPWIASTGF